MSYSADSAPTVFICYRRDDTGPYAGRLYDRIATAIGEENVFMDVDSISLGHDYTDAIRNAVSSCDVLLALIGPDWLAVSNEGRTRLDDEDDYVRIEIETALRRNIRLVPILVGDARLPTEVALPTSLAPLVRRQALHLSHDKFRVEAVRLIDDLIGPTPRSSSEESFGARDRVPAERTARDEHASGGSTGHSRVRPRVELLHKSTCSISLLVELSERHIIDLNKCTVFETLSVDGEVIAKKMTLDDAYKFVIEDSGAAVGAIIAIDTTWIGHLRDVTLHLGDQLAFSLRAGAVQTQPGEVEPGSAINTKSGAVPSGWYADPSGRYELRFWNGETWTEHVSRAGTQFTDPPVA